MEKDTGILDSLAKEYGVYISDLRLSPDLRRRVLARLRGMDAPDKQRAEWLEAMTYLREEAQSV